MLDAVSDRYHTYLGKSPVSIPTPPPTIPILGTNFRGVTSDPNSAANLCCIYPDGVESRTFLPSERGEISISSKDADNYSDKRSHMISCEDNVERRRRHEDAVYDCIVAPAQSSSSKACLASNASEVITEDRITTLKRKRSSGNRKNLSAKEHFTKRGSMSPLQRCSDIVFMVWPLVLILSVSCTVNKASEGIVLDSSKGIHEIGAQPTAVESRRASDHSFGVVGNIMRDHKNENVPSSAADCTSLKSIAPIPGTILEPSDQPIRIYEVTDGWWWTKAVLDPELNRLVEMGVLSDGCKIAVFAAQFEMESGSENASCCIKLAINSVRKGSCTAALGFLSPPSLARGLSLKSISHGGGPVFAIRVRVLFICPQMVKVTAEGSNGHQSQKRKKDIPPPLGATRSHSGGGDRDSLGVRAVVLDACEANELRAIMSKRSSLIEDSLEGDEQLSLASLLDYLGCDDWLVDFFLVSSNTHSCVTSYSAYHRS